MVKIGMGQGLAALAAQGKECHLENVSLMWEPQEPQSTKAKVLIFRWFNRIWSLGERSVIY